MRRELSTVAASVAVALAMAPAAEAASQLVLDGRGYGHGVGMSQYGALGYARHGWTADRILRHYYGGTKLDRLSSSPTVRVLLQSARASYVVRGASSANGELLDPAVAYTVSAGEKGLVVRGGGRSWTTAGTLRLSPPGSAALQLDGPAQNGTSSGRYRGALEVRSAAGGLNAVNAVALEDYVAGVISAEVPASWPAETLRAQAIAARTYAITTNAGGNGFTQWADTRSQMYRGVAAETAATNAATRATAGQVVTYDGAPVPTFFFSTSGGRTENVENSFLGATPKPWLRSVRDQYDTVSPYHRWGPVRLSLSAATAKLGSLVKGRLRLIRVTRRGVSPRIVAAQIVGSRGTTQVTGPQLRRALGLRDTWIRLRTFSTDVSRSAPPTAVPRVAARRPAAGTTIGTGRLVLTGRIAPATRGARATIQRRGADGRWHRARVVRIGGSGAVRATLPGAGRYRLAYGGLTGPAVRAE